MLNRFTLFRRYLDPTTISSWFDDRVLPTPATVNAVAIMAVEEFASKKIGYDEFCLVCMNLHFEAGVRYAADQTKELDPNVSRLIRSFADPSGDELDSDGHLRGEMQDSMLSAITSRRAA